MAQFTLCIDVGNSRTKFGLIPRVPPVRQSASRGAAELPTCRSAAVVPHGQQVRWPTIRENFSLAAGDDVRGYIAGSNPENVETLRDGWPEDWPAPVVLDDVSRFPLQVRLDAPNKVGIDRILNAVACNVIRPSGQPALIVDTGTATTVDAVAPDGAFEGGAILPGFELCARALNQYTALLPFVTIDELIEESHEPLGLNTREALRSGLFWGQIGAIRELVERLSARWNEPPLLLVTGGGAPLASPQLSLSRWEPQLSLQGLAIVAEHFGEAERDRRSG